MGVEDNLISSSIEDYQNNVCAICHHDNEKWDLWSSCHHLFCQDCSSEMLSRGMPCPLCRASSATILRGNCFKQPCSDAGMKKEVPVKRKVYQSRRQKRHQQPRVP